MRGEPFKAHNLKLPNICHCSETPILEIAENIINEIFTAHRYKLNTHFDCNLIYFY